MNPRFYSGAIRTPVKWSPPVGSAIHEHHYGRILPMHQERKPSLWQRLMGRVA